MAAWPKRGDTQAGGTAYQTRPGPPPQSSSSLHGPGGAYLPTAATASSRRSSSSSSSRSSSAGNLQHNNRSAVHQANNSPGQGDDEDEDEDGDDDNYEEISGEDTAMAQNDPTSAASIRASTTASKRTTKKSTSTTKPSSSTIAPTSTSTSSSRKRKRVSRACDACYIRKDKCDGASPSCSICARLSRSCTYTRPEKKRGPQQGVRGRLEAQCAGLEAVLGWILWCARCEVQEGEGGGISRYGGAGRGRGSESDVKSGTVLKLLLQPSMVATSAMWSPSFAFPPPSSSLMSLAQLWRTSVLATYLTSPLAPSSPGLAIGLEGAASVADGLDADLASRQAGGEVGILGSGDPHPAAGGENEERSDEDEVDGVENVSPDGSHRRRSSRGGGGVESSNHKPTKTPTRPPGRTRRTLDPAPAVRKPAPNPAAAYAPVSRGPPPPRPSRPDDGLPLGTSPEAMNGSEGLTQRQEQIIVEPGADVWARPIVAAHHTGQQTRAVTDNRDSFVFPPPPSSSGTGWKAHGHSHSHESHQRPSDGTAQMGMGVSSGPGEWSRGAYGGNDQNRPGQTMHHNGGQSEANITLYPSGHASQISSTVPDSSSSIHAASRNAWGVPGPAASAAPSTHADYNIFNTNNNNNNNNLSSFYFDTRDSFSFTDPDAQALLYALGMSAATVNGGGGGGSGNHMEGMNVQGMGGSLYAAGPQMSGGGGGSNQQGSGSGSGSLGGATYHATGEERVGHQLRQDRSSTEGGASSGAAGRWDGVVGGGGAGNAGSTAAVGRKSVVGTNNVPSLETAAHASILFQLGLQEDAFGNSALNFPFGDWLGGGGASGAAVGGSSSDPQPNSTTTSAGQKTLIATTPTSSNPVQATHQQHPRRSMPTSRSAQSVGGGGAAPTTTTTFVSGTGVAGRVRLSTGPSPPDVSDTLRQFQMQAAEFIRRDPFGSGSGAGGTGTGTGAGAGAR
ncbi:hypothetical protein CF319_g3186 [Tilletia indica]|nr:hypothetical protein CF319_g3186 [Tilletia indica]